MQRLSLFQQRVGWKHTIPATALKLNTFSTAKKYNFYLKNSRVNTNPCGAVAEAREMFQGDKRLLYPRGSHNLYEILSRASRENTHPVDGHIQIPTHAYSQSQFWGMHG